MASALIAAIRLIEIVLINMISVGPDLAEKSRSSGAVSGTAGGTHDTCCDGLSD